VDAVGEDERGAGAGEAAEVADVGEVGDEEGVDAGGCRGICCSLLPEGCAHPIDSIACFAEGATHAPVASLYPTHG